MKRFTRCPTCGGKRQNREYARSYEAGTCREPRLKGGYGCGASTHE